MLLLGYSSEILSISEACLSHIHFDHQAFSHPLLAAGSAICAAWDIMKCGYHQVEGLRITLNKFLATPSIDDLEACPASSQMVYNSEVYLASRGLELFINSTYWVWDMNTSHWLTGVGGWLDCLFIPHSLWKPDRLGLICKLPVLGRCRLSDTAVNVVLYSTLNFCSSETACQESKFCVL